MQYHYIKHENLTFSVVNKLSQIFFKSWLEESNSLCPSVASGITTHRKHLVAQYCVLKNLVFQDGDSEVLYC